MKTHLIILHFVQYCTWFGSLLITSHSILTFTLTDEPKWSLQVNKNLFMLNPNLHIPHPSQWNCPLSVSSNSLHTEQKWAEPNTVPHPVLETRLIHERNGHSEDWREIHQKSSLAPEDSGLSPVSLRTCHTPCLTWHTPWPRLVSGHTPRTPPGSPAFGQSCGQTLTRHDRTCSGRQSLNSHFTAIHHWYMRIYWGKEANE